jgi:DNA-binding NarL/FixJ family response regulator
MIATSPRIVIVEDDPLLLSLLVDLLTEVGYEVYPHRGAADAHLVISRVQPHVVLLDLRLGTGPKADESGWGVLDRLVIDPATRDIPVVLATGAVASVEAHRPALIPEHGVRVLLKPYDLDELLSVLAGIVRQLRTPESQADGAQQNDRGLTPRQREIARLIALGCTNREIGRRLVLEPGTVANHVAHILDRLGLANRAQVASWATRQGLVDRPAALERAHVA